MSQAPIRPSHEDARRWEPDASVDMNGIGLVCRCREATVDALGPPELRYLRVRHAVRSCDERARMRDSSDDKDGRTQTEVMGAWCTEASRNGLCE